MLLSPKSICNQLKRVLHALVVASMSPEAAQTVITPIPHQSRPPSPDHAKGSPCTQAPWQQTHTWVQGCSLPARLQTLPEQALGVTTCTQGVQQQSWDPAKALAIWGCTWTARRSSSVSSARHQAISCAVEVTKDEIQGCSVLFSAHWKEGWRVEAKWSKGKQNFLH